ncbi:MAG: DNA polymerase III subunit alpha [Pseudomonadota bacterium]
MNTNFTHLNLHTEYSIVDGLIRIDKLVENMQTLNMPSIAVTDYKNLFAAIKFYRAAIASGIKPIIGAELQVEGLAQNAAASNVIFLCKDNLGYKNLTSIITKSYLDGQTTGVPIIQRSWLKNNNEGLIALSCGLHGDVGHALLYEHQSFLDETLLFWKQCFEDRFYLEISRTGKDNEEEHIARAINLAHSENLPIVATNAVRFLNEEDYEIHEAKVCIQEGRTLNDKRQVKNFSQKQYLRSSDEMCKLFEDIPEAIENSIEISKRCNVEFQFGKVALPAFPTPNKSSVEQFLESQAHAGLESRIQSGAVDDSLSKEKYLSRLKEELEVISRMGYAGYFLIVSDFIAWAKSNDIPVGPGRGSGAGSLVAYSLGITNLDPLRYDLLFERFLNPERISLPDFDIDFCMDKRDQVIDYVAKRYGREKVSQIITYGSMSAKAVLRDVGRVLGYPYGFVDRIAKLVPFEPGITLSRAIEEEQELSKSYKNDSDVKEIINMSLALEGLSRSAGKHAGGVVISPSPLTDFTPLYCEPGGASVVTQLDMHDVETMGLIKFDFLGLRTLTIIDKAVKLINRQNKKENRPLIDIETIPLNDQKTFELLQSQRTIAVFQLESRGIRDIIKRLKPDCFDDIVSLVALYRPGPLQSGMVDDYIERKHGRQLANFLHPDLEDILRPTFGVILYQEQVMQIAQRLAGYKLGDADLLRRAMGKKKPEEMAEQRKVFVAGAIKHGVEETRANYIFDLMEKFAGYGFNKSHSVAYALLAYQTAWLKTHYKEAFMAAVLSADMDNTDKVVRLIDECRALGLQIAGPNINKSKYSFTVVNKNTILYGLGAIKGVGKAAIENIEAMQEKHGDFKDLNDLCAKSDSQKLNRRVLEALIVSGSMDSIESNRALLMNQLSIAMLQAEQHQRNESLGQNDMFGGFSKINTPAKKDFNSEEAWSEQKRLSGERNTLGLYLTGHPVERYKKELVRITGQKIVDILNTANERVVHTSERYQRKVTKVAGLIMTMRVRNIGSSKLAFAVLDDNSARMEAVLDYEKHGHLLNKDQILIIQGYLKFDEYTQSQQIRAQEVFSLDEARRKFATGLRIKIKTEKQTNGLLDEIYSVLSSNLDGECEVRIDVENNTAASSWLLAESWRISPNEDMLEKLQGINGVLQTDILYSGTNKKVIE